MRGISTSKPATLVIAACLLTVFFPAAGTVMAAGDGSSCAGSVPAIADAVAEANEGETITVCANTSAYELDDGLEITTPGVTLTADGDATLSFTGNDEGTATISVAAAGVTVEGLTIERGTDADRGEGSGFAQAVRVAASDVTIVDNVIVGTANLDDPNNAGVMVLDGTGNAPRNVTNVAIEGNTVSGFAYGLGAVAAYGTNVTVSDVAFNDNDVTENTEAGIALADGTSLAALGLPNGGDAPDGNEAALEDVTARHNLLQDNPLAVLNAAVTLFDARFNYYGPAGPATELFAGAVLVAPWCATPDCTLDEDLEPPEQPDPPEMPPVPGDGSAVEIIEPASDASFAPGADITVTWLAPIDDLYVNQLYRVELIGDGADDRGVEQATGPEEACRPVNPTTWRCHATLENVDVGEDKVITVRPTVTQNDTLADLTSPLCYTTTDVLCDAINGIDIGQITEISPEPTPGWTNDPYEGLISCELKTCDINFDVHDADDDAGPFRVTQDEASITVDEEGEQEITWFGVDENGNEEDPKNRTLLLDLTDPTTDITVTAEEGDNGWYTSTATVNLTAKDSVSDVELTEYDTGSGWTTYTEEFPITDEGTTAVDYRSVDKASNTETTQTETVKIDTADPTTEITLDGEEGDNGWYTSPVTVNLTAEDETSGVGVTEYRVDDGDWLTYHSNFTVDTEGTTDIHYRTIDNAGNNETVQTEPVKIDTVDPTTEITLDGDEGNNGWYTSPVTVALDGTDKNSGVDVTEYRLDDGPWQTYDGSFTVDAEGITDIHYRTIDNASNTETAQTETVEIDTVAPDTTATLDGEEGDNGWYTSPVTVTLDGNDASSGLNITEYRLDDGPWQTYDGSFSVDAEGTTEVDFRSTDDAGNTEATQTETIKIDTVTPETTASLAGPEGGGGWYTGSVDVTLDATDATSGVSEIQYRLDGGSWTTYEGTFTVDQDGTTTLDYRAIDAASNVETAGTETIEIDTVAPTTTETLDGDQDDTGTYTTPVTVTLTGEDAASGVAETTYKLDDGSWTTYNGSFEVSEDGNHTLAFRSTDVATNEEGTNEVSFAIDKPAVIDLELRSHDTFLPNDDSEDLVFEATWVEGENAGEPADGETVVLSDANSNFEATATTNADGLASFTLSETDLQRNLSATIQDPSYDADVLDPEPTTITWTDITVERVPGEDVTDATQGWANVGGTYRVAYQVNTTWNGEPLEDATVRLDSGDFTSTGADGIAHIPTSSDSPTETTFAAEASYNPADGPEQTASAANTATVKWAKVVFENLDPTPANATHWYDAGDTQTFSFEAYVDYGVDRIAAEDAEVTIEAASSTSDADETQTVVVAQDATASADLSFAENARTTPTLTLTSTPQGISVQDAADFGDQRWATLVVDSLNVTNENTSAYQDGWHAIGDEVTFDFTADLVYGADRDEHAIPAEDTLLTFSLDENETVNVSANGEETVAKTISEAFEGTPTIALQETPEGVTATNISAFDEQRWTELDLSATPDDDFVNVNDTVSFDLSATWTHDGSPAQGVDVQVLAADGTVVEDCDVFDGTSTCDVTLDAVYADNLTFEATTTDVGITQQTDKTPTEVPMVWTQIRVSSLTVDDGFVDVGDTIAWDATAFYAHSADGIHPAVGNATLALASGAPSQDCTLDTGVIADGNVTAKVTCDAVVDERIPLTVASADDDVTRLVEPLELFDTNRSTNPVWTGFFVDHTATDEDGNELADGTLLDHNEPVRFEGSVQFAHMADNENATQPPTDWVEFTVEENGSIVSNCIEKIDAHGSADCVTEVRKEEGNHTFTAGASSFDENGEGIFVRDVTDVRDSPDQVRFRWTSIAFQAFDCVGTHSGDQDCETYNWTPGERVDVTVTTIEADTGNVLPNATITIDGNQETTDENGTATRSFISFGSECLDVTAAGEEATIEDQTVTWDRPRTETICWD